MCKQLKSLAIAAALSALAGAAAHAQTITQSRTVSYADLDLSSRAGMNTLMSRINSAAQDVCGLPPDARESHTAYDACIKAAVNGALVQVAHADVSRQLAANAQRRHGG